MDIDPPVHLHVTASSPAPALSTLPTYPSAFMLRHINSPIGAVILSSPDLTLARFTELALARPGFNVAGRMSAVVPKFFRVAPIDSLVGIESGETWRVVRQVLGVMGRRVGEVVVG
jgi:hypothetical protein